MEYMPRYLKALMSLRNLVTAKLDTLFTLITRSIIYNLQASIGEQLDH